MVYCGRPSTGCGNCKSRRIKCDEARPSCQNCIKTNRECPGYPSEVDLIFRKEDPGRRKRSRKSPSKKDESDTTRSKRRYDEISWTVDLGEKSTAKRQRRGTDATVEGYKSLQWVYIDARRANSVPDVVRQARLTPSIEKQAISFFMNTFALSPENRDTPSSFLDVAAPMVDDASDASPLSFATKAAALAAMAKSPGSEHLIQHAAQCYGKALAATQKTMQNGGSQATSDETLLAILLFALYESMTSTEHSTAAWQKHIEGAVAIVRARGTQQFEDPRSLSLFRSVRTQMLMNALHRHEPVPEFPGPHGWLGDLQDTDSTGFGLLESCVAVPDILSRASTLLAEEESPQTRSRVEALLDDALDAQNNLSTWEEHVPEHWRRAVSGSATTSHQPRKGQDAKVGPYHMPTSPDPKYSSICNNHRVNQMLCSSVVIGALKWLDYTNDQRYKFAEARVQAVVDNVCCSVPFHLSDDQPDVGLNANPHDRSVAGSIGAQSLIWCMYTAISMPCIPDVQRQWLRERLPAVARRSGKAVSQRNSNNHSNPGQDETQSSYIGQSLQDDQYSEQIFGAPDYTAPTSSRYPVNEIEDVDIDPVLLLDGFDNPHLNSEESGFNSSIITTLPPLQGEAIKVA